MCGAIFASNTYKMLPSITSPRIRLILAMIVHHGDFRVEPVSIGEIGSKKMRGYESGL
jgi:hypothetical protein